MCEKAQESPYFWRFLRFSLVLALCGAAACRAPRAMIDEDVSFSALDGETVHATLYTPAQARPPAMLLLHMLGSDRRAWDDFAQDAAARGYMSLAIDLRGHGDARDTAATSQTPGAQTQDPGSPDATFQHDLGPAIDYLIERGADPENVFIVGASLGANLALRFAVDEPRIQAVVMLSPGESYRGVTVLPELESFTRPVLILATEGDSYSAATGRKMQAASDNYCELRTYPGSAHGTGILDAIHTAAGQIFLWLEPMVQEGVTSAETDA